MDSRLVDIGGLTLSIPHELNEASTGPQSADLSKYSSSLIIQLSHMTMSCSCAGVLEKHKQTNNTKLVNIKTGEE